MRERQTHRQRQRQRRGRQGRRAMLAAWVGSLPLRGQFWAFSWGQQARQQAPLTAVPSHQPIQLKEYTKKPLRLTSFSEPPKIVLMRVCMFVCDVCVTCVDTCRGMFVKWVGVRGQFLQSALPRGPHSDHQAYILRYQAANIFTYDWATSLPAHVFLFIRILNFLPIVCTISSCTKKLSILSVYPRILFNHNRMAGTSLKQTDNARQGHRSHRKGRSDTESKATGLASWWPLGTSWEMAPGVCP